MTPGSPRAHQSPPEAGTPPGSAGPEETGAPPLVAEAREFLNYLRVERGLSPNTISAYRRTLARYVDYLRGAGVVSADGITRDMVASFATELAGSSRGGMSSRSMAQAFSALRMFHRFLSAEGISDTDPSSVLVTPRAPLRLPRALSREQVSSLLDTPGGDSKGIRDRLVLEMLYATGMRISELVGLDLGDVDLQERVLICRGKGGKFRMIPFGRAAAGAAERYLEEARPLLAGPEGNTALILNMRGGRLTRQGCWKIIKGRAAQAGLEEVVTPHALRHTFATHMLEGGAGLLVVQELLGHASIATTQIYTEVTGDRLSQVYLGSHPRA